MSIFDLLETADEPETKQKKATKQVDEKVKKEDKAGKQAKFKYPFKIHAYAQNLDISGMFEDDKEYLTDEITRIMLEHRYFDFAGEVTYEFKEAENTLLPKFKQHKKG